MSEEKVFPGPIRVRDRKCSGSCYYPQNFPLQHTCRILYTMFDGIMKKLTQDVITSIILRLAVKSLLRYKYLQNLVYSILSIFM